MEYQRLEDGGEESHACEAHDSDGHVARLDGGVEQNPMEAQKGAAAGDLKELSLADFRKSCEYDEYGRREEQPVPDQRGLVECDEFPEQSGEPRQQDAQVELYDSFFKTRFSHDNRNCLQRCVKNVYLSTTFLTNSSRCRQGDECVDVIVLSN